VGVDKGRKARALARGGGGAACWEKAEKGGTGVADGEGWREGFPGGLNGVITTAHWQPLALPACVRLLGRGGGKQHTKGAVSTQVSVCSAAWLILDPVSTTQQGSWQWP